MNVDIGLKIRKSFKSIDLSIWSLVPKAGPAEKRSSADGISRRVLTEISLRSNLEPSSCSFCIYSNTVLTVGLGAPSGPISV